MAVDAADQDGDRALQFQRLAAAIRVFYRQTWEAWYRIAPDAKPAALVIESSDHTSIYRPEWDVICLYVTDDQLGHEDADEATWPTWKVELVHEMLHEWEHKAFAPPSAAGEALWRSRSGCFEADHEAAFFTAIVDKATYFGLTPEEFIASL
jgi:hypothetical protein